MVSRSSTTQPFAGPAHAGPGHELTCLLTPLHSERSLSRALLEHLSQELPDLDFTLEDRDDVDVLWVCGYERGNADLIRSLRKHHPFALLLVTAREPEEVWSAEVHAAGADLAVSLPLDIARLGQTLRRRVRLRRA